MSEPEYKFNLLWVKLFSLETLFNIKTLLDNCIHLMARVFYTTGATSGVGTVYPSGALEHWSPVFSGFRVTVSLVLCVCFINRCMSFCIFLWPLCCLILITPLVSSNSSYIDRILQPLDTWTLISILLWYNNTSVWNLTCLFHHDNIYFTHVFTYHV
jgi:hypothetical protein